MSETEGTEAGYCWPSWADTPEKRERNRQYWQEHNARVREAREHDIPGRGERAQLILTVRLGRWQYVIPTPVYRAEHAGK